MLAAARTAPILGRVCASGRSVTFLSLPDSSRPQDSKAQFKKETRTKHHHLAAIHHEAGDGKTALGARQEPTPVNPPTPIPPPPVKLPLNRLYLEYTNRCNMACAFCPYPLQTRPKGKLEYELVKRMVDEVVDNQITTLIEVTGYGEPLLNPDWYRISRHILESNVNSEQLAELPFEDVIISLQTPDAESFKIRKAAIDFETYTARVRQFVAIHSRKNAPSRLRLRFLNTSGTPYMSFPEQVSVLNSREQVVAGMKEWVKIVLDVTGRPYDEERVDLELRAMAKLQPTMVHVTRNVTLESHVCSDYWIYGTGQPVRFPTRFARCRSMTLESALVYHDGQVSLCCADFDNHLNIGSLATQSLMEALCSPQAAAFIEGFRRFRVRHPYCQSCLGARSPFVAATKALVASLYMLNVGEYREITLSGR